MPFHIRPCHTSLVFLTLLSTKSLSILTRHSRAVKRQMKYFYSTVCGTAAHVCTCGSWVSVGEVLVALQFDFIKDVHLLLSRERTIEPHLWSTANGIGSVALCRHMCGNHFSFWLFSHIWDIVAICCGQVITKKATDRNNIFISLFLCFLSLTYYYVF